MVNIATINYFISGKEVVNTTITGQETLLDSDLVIANPSEFDQAWTLVLGNSNRGSYENTRKIKSIFNSRKSELATLLDRGKILVVFLSPMKMFKGENNYGQTEYVYNYDFLPSGKELLMNQLTHGVSKVANAIRMTNDKHLFSGYFKSLKDELEYSSYLDLEHDNEPEYFLQNKSNKPVGFSMTCGNGLIVFLPAPRSIDNERIIGTFISCANRFLAKHSETPMPNWVSGFPLHGEDSFDTEIAAISLQIEELIKKREEKEREKYELIKFKQLLYENGERLENIVLSFFGLIGFKAYNRKSEDLEHDVVFESKEGKGVAEIEGRDNDSIHVGKIDQLNRAIDEDFDKTNSYAQGVLIGNHFRLLHPENRKDPFTEKVKLVAQKKSFGLLTTTEMFYAVEFLFRNPDDEGFKESCRRKILNTTGAIIKLI